MRSTKSLWGSLGMAVSIAACGGSDPETENRAPIISIDVSPGTSVDEREITLDASSSRDPDGDPLRFRWVQLEGEPGALTDASEPVTRFIAGPRTTTATLSLSASDAGSSTTETVEVEFLDRPPTQVLLPLGRVEKNRPVELNLTASTDDSGVPLTPVVEVVSAPIELTVTEIAPLVIELIPTLSGTYVIDVALTDGWRTSEPERVTIVVENRAPVVEVVGPSAADRGDTVVLNAGGSSDPDGDPLTFVWSFQEGPVPVALGDGPVVSFEVTIPGTYSFLLRISDDEGLTVDRTVLLEVTNQAPEISIVASTDVFDGDAITLDGSGTIDAEGDVLTFSWEQLSGPAIELQNASTAIATGIAAGPGERVFELTVDDGWTRVSETVTVGVQQARPVADPGEDRTVNGGELVMLEAVNVQSRFTYRWEQSGGGDLGLGVVDGPRLWVRAPSGDANLDFELTVSDGGVSDSKSVAIMVESYGGASVAVLDNPLVEPVVLTPEPFDTFIGNGNLLVAGGDVVGDNLWVIDVSEPRSPSILATADGLGLTGDIAFDGTRIFTLSGVGQLKSWTFSGNTILSADTLGPPAPYTRFAQLTQYGDYVYLAALNDDTVAVIAVDATDPTELAIVADEVLDTGFFASFPPVFQLAATDQYVLFAQDENERYLDITSAPTGVITSSPNYRILNDLEDVRDVVAGPDNDFVTAAQEFYRHVGGTSRDGPLDFAFDLDEPGLPGGLAVSNDLLVVALGFAGVGVYQLESPPTLANEPVMDRRALIPTGAWTDTVAIAGASLFAKVGTNEVFTAPLSTTVTRPSLATIRRSGNFRPTDVVVEEGRLFTSGRFGALAYDVSDPFTPVFESSLPMSGIRRLAKSGDLLIGTGNEESFTTMVIVDVGVPRQPRTHSTVSSCSVSIAALSFLERIYAACGRYGLQVLDPNGSGPAVVLDTFTTDNQWYRALARAGDRLYAHRSFTTEVWDISDPNQAVLLGSNRNFTQNMPWVARGAIVLAPNPFARTSADPDLPAFTVVDFSDPATPARETSLRGIPGYPQDLELHGDLLFGAVDSSFVAIDISDLEAPVLLTRFDAGSDARSISIAGEYVYAAEDRAFGRQNEIRVLPVEPMRFTERQVQASTATPITYEVRFAGLGDSPTFVCQVTGGTCEVSANTGNSVVVTWTTPALAGDHEIVVSGGRPNAWARIMDRVRLE